MSVVDQLPSHYVHSYSSLFFSVWSSVYTQPYHDVHRINLLLGVLGVHFIHHFVMMFHLLILLGLDITNHLLVTFFFIHHLLVVLGLEMTDHLIMTLFCIYIILVVIGIYITDHLLIIVLLQLTFILVKNISKSTLL